MPPARMCGRYLTPDEAAFERHFGLEAPNDYFRSYNVAPSARAPVVRIRSDGTKVAELFVWGFEPPWARRSWINARSETVFTSTAFASAAATHRCIVPAAGWYEWQGERAPKQPYVHYRGDFEPIAFAGIWTTAGAERERRRTFAILTKPATPDVAFAHDRMPVVLDPADYARWLSPAASRNELEALLLEPRSAIRSRRISPHVNKPANDDERCIEPFSGGDAGLFGPGG